MGNYAYIDAQNLNRGIQGLGWKLDWRRFRVYLHDKYQVTKAYLFLGYLPEHQDVYTALQKADYQLLFKPVAEGADGGIKGNVDADLVLQVMIDYAEYDQAVIVTSDGDFQGLVNHLYVHNKLRVVLSPDIKKCSILLKKAAREKIGFMYTLETKLGYNKKKHRSGTKPLRSASSS